MSTMSPAIMSIDVGPVIVSGTMIASIIPSSGAPVFPPPPPEEGFAFVTTSKVYCQCKSPRSRVAVKVAVPTPVATMTPPI